MSGNLERRYRRVLALLPGWYRRQWEDEMVAAFLDSRLTGDPAADDYISRAAGPGLAEIASVAGLAVRLYLGGAGGPRRSLARAEAVRRAVLAVILVHAVLGLDVLARTAWSRRIAGLPAPPASLAVNAPGGLWPATFDLVNVAWIVIFVMLALGRHRAARIIAVPAIVPGLVALVQARLTGIMPAPFGSLAWWVLLGLVPVLAMTAFRAGAPAAARRPWLLALPAGCLLVVVPMLAAQATGREAWLPDMAGLCCVLVALACLAHAPRAWSRRAAGSGVWSLALTLLGGLAGTYRVITALGNYLSDPHLMAVSLAELLILAAAVALVAPDAARTRAGAPASPPQPRPQPG